MCCGAENTLRHHYCGSLTSSIYNQFSIPKYAASLVSRNERDEGQRGGEGSGQGLGPILLTREKLYCRDCSHKWTQTYESKSSSVRAVYLKPNLCKGITPLSLCRLILQSRPIFKLANKPGNTASLFATKQPHLQARVSAARQGASVALSLSSSVHYQGTL